MWGLIVMPVEEAFCFSSFLSGLRAVSHTVDQHLELILWFDSEELIQGLLQNKYIKICSLVRALQFDWNKRRKTSGAKNCSEGVFTTGVVSNVLVDAVEKLPNVFIFSQSKYSSEGLIA